MRKATRPVEYLGKIWKFAESYDVIAIFLQVSTHLVIITLPIVIIGFVFHWFVFSRWRIVLWRDNFISGTINALRCLIHQRGLRKHSFRPMSESFRSV